MKEGLGYLSDGDKICFVLTRLSLFWKKDGVTAASGYRLAVGGEYSIADEISTDYFSDEVVWLEACVLTTEN